MDDRLNDYNNYDKLVLYVKNEQSYEIIKYYEALGYELISKHENKKYSDTIDLTFVRPHKICNKDALQLLQVHLETELNKLGKCKKYKHSLSINLGLTLGFLGVLFFVFSLNKLLMATILYKKIIFSCFGLVGLIIIFINLVIVPKIIKKEKQNFLDSSYKINKNIKKILKKIKETRGLNDKEKI